MQIYHHHDDVDDCCGYPSLNLLHYTLIVFKTRVGKLCHSKKVIIFSIHYSMFKKLHGNVLFCMENWWYAAGR